MTPGCHPGPADACATGLPARLVLTLLPLLALTVAACDAVDGPDAGAAIVEPVRRDSAGIEIVVNRAPAWTGADGWEIAPTPSVSIGGVASATGALVWEVGGAARLSDGRLVLLAGGRTAPRLLIFDRAGELVRSIGRLGRGPGEFVEPVHLQRLPGDTLVVWERHYGRITAFDTTGAVTNIRHLDLERVLPAVRLEGGSQLRLPLADGSFVARAMLPVPSASQDVWQRAPVVYVRIRSDYSADTLGWFEGPAHAYLSSSNGAFPVFPLFTVNSTVAAGTAPLRTYISNGDEIGIRVFGEDGELARIIRTERPPSRISREDRELALSRLGAFNNWTPEQRGRWEGYLDQLPPQIVHPPVRDMLVDRTGYLWVLERLADSRGGSWSVFDPSGRWLGRIELPLWQIYDIGEDFVVGVALDDMLVQSVHEYRLSRP